jgi:hypothetical protein
MFMAMSVTMITTMSMVMSMAMLAAMPGWAISTGFYTSPIGKHDISLRF